ncbi:MAG: TonB-dependent receptor family protein [Saprospiraceae bacterium]
MRNSLMIILTVLLQVAAVGQNTTISFQIKDAETEVPLSEVSIFDEANAKTYEVNKEGELTIQVAKEGAYTFLVFKEEYESITRKVIVRKGKQKNVIVLLEKLNYQLSTVEVPWEEDENTAQGRLRNVEGTAIYAAKKSEVIQLKKLTANLAINNPRQVYKGIPGLNIWESDGAGLQLSIGARGLNPNRSSNFNTRQNGYDISADALGYPESYYTPPTQALERIEIVRGAASLQYGTQFGGLLNFVFKKGPTDKPFEFTSEATIGSFGLRTAFHSVGGTVKGYNYYAFYQRKQGDGWRPNSEFEQNTAYASVHKNVTKKLRVGFEYTLMNYLAQQSGGLQDFEFEADARQSKRSRNWFAVDWNLTALHLDYKVNDKTKINSRSFFLYAKRDALGELGPINRPDPLRERDLIRGQYQNFGNETRLITRYNIKGRLSTFLTGFRYYQGFTQNKQGDASDGSDPDFTFTNPNDLERSAYEFPSRNIAVFAENLFQLNAHWTLTPGVRFEYIRTASDGFYKERVLSGGQVIFEQRFEDSKSNERNFALLGLGIGYKPSTEVEFYGNISQNYRSINFSDLAVVNPNLIVDSLLQDEKGFNADFGIRGTALRKALVFDASIFYLDYQNRIGTGEIVISDPVVVERSVAFRTNIGNARIIGLEAYAEWQILKSRKEEKQKTALSIFGNFSLLYGRYTDGERSFNGNEVESIPPISFKTGINFGWNGFRLAYQINYVEQHFSDATNAVFVADATRGIIPSYQVQDISISYDYKVFNIQAGVNNLLDERYFTRRAAAYPGPGIIPSDGRGYYAGVKIQI